MSIPTQDIHENAMAPTPNQPFYPFVATYTSISCLPNNDHHSQSTLTSPPLWGTPPFLQPVRPQTYGENSWGVSSSLPPPLSDPGPMIPRWITPWSLFQPERAGSQLLHSHIEMPMSIPTVPCHSRNSSRQPQEDTREDSCGLLHRDHHSQVLDLTLLNYLTYPSAQVLSDPGFLCPLSPLSVDSIPASMLPSETFPSATSNSVPY
ncbi:hypothetical protein BDM02DRAFT_2707817 [Thelephora ganbajun]|uniref:Uncharacterized protein n=1 Tax=Thelephora ganbajun TaxID=370292 RepID=A0ACB6ZC80_THEGA|nr:hypothetical protein BDM02DRAFT_2707817 [Thelephora ganbajun]